ncbi:MAG: hypothetical protein JXR53_13425 [Bacteroidales bacterium]|nr:hypothetical protein [Bacteroidales bacterium]
MKVDKTEIQKLVKELIGQGKSKQEVYDEMVGEFQNRKMIAEIVRFTPSVTRLKKYGIWNNLYLVFVSIITILSFYRPTLGIIWLGLLVIIVASKRFKYYYWNTLLGLIIIIVSCLLALRYFMNGNGFDSVGMKFLLALFIGIIFTIGGALLPKILTPKYKEKWEKYLDNNGIEKMRIQYVFEIDVLDKVETLEAKSGE